MRIQIALSVLPQQARPALRRALARVRNWRAVYDPLSRLPNEVLLNIFQHYNDLLVKENQGCFSERVTEPLMQLRWVCARWDDVLSMARFRVMNEAFGPDQQGAAYGTSYSKHVYTYRYDKSKRSFRVEQDSLSAFCPQGAHNWTTVARTLDSYWQPELWTTGGCVFCCVLLLCFLAGLAIAIWRSCVLNVGTSVKS